MKREMACVCALFLVAEFLASSSVQAESPTPQATLTQYIPDLHKNPNDYALRERIIKLAQEMKPAPAIPEEARRHYVMALTLFRGAKKIEDYGEPIDEFKSALLVAPWWAEANRDLGMALEAAKRYDDAISALTLYMASSPGEEKARAAQDEIYKIEGMKKLAAREKQEASPPAVSASKQDTFEDLLRKIDGRRYTTTQGAAPGITAIIDVRGKVLVCGYEDRNGYHENSGPVDRVQISGRETTVHLPTPAVPEVMPAEHTFIISGDGDTITDRYRYIDGRVRDSIFLWQR